MHEAIENTVTGLLALSALTIAGILVRRELQQPPPRVGPAQTLTPVRFEDSVAAARIRLGGDSGTVQVTEFVDYECPFCRRFEAALRRFDSLHPGNLTTWVVHFPLPSHRFALPAARAAECAAEQGAFAAMHRLLFEKQDSLGPKSWGSYAVEAGVPDTAQLLACTARSQTFPRIVAGRAVGERERVTSTPTVIVNNWRLGRPPTEEELTLIVADLKAGRKPSVRGEGAPQ